MINDRPTKNIWIAITEDPALSPVDDRVMSEYKLTRDLKKLEPDFDAENGVYKPTGDRVSMVKVVPLKSEKSNLREYGIDGLRAIVQHHIVGVKNLGTVHVRIDEDGNGKIPDGDMKKIDDKTLAEIARVVLDLGDGADGIDRPFSWQDSSPQERMRLRRLDANAARISRAMATEEDSDTENQSMQMTESS